MTRELAGAGGLREEQGGVGAGGAGRVTVVESSPRDGALDGWTQG